ncbi:hypothetical protein [Amycolatopsis sp. NPDC004079]|uniref:hypothetical protein n=1 Tax=Amycolatopsis sp. NPDC004079 TaxID=3154549 RepID=UPI0033B9C3F6
MGASKFLIYQDGADADKAFCTAVADAQLWRGSGGNTGTIAEKAAAGFLVVSADPVAQEQAEKMGAAILDGRDEQWAEILEKDGPVGAIAVKGGPREHHVRIPDVPGGHADLDAAVAAATAGVLAVGERVVGEAFGSYRTDGVRVLGGTLIVPTEGAQVHTGWEFFGVSRR